jgi:hypothetical protein
MSASVAVDRSNALPLAKAAGTEDSASSAVQAIETKREVFMMATVQFLERIAGCDFSAW